PPAPGELPEPLASSGPRDVSVQGPSLREPHRRILGPPGDPDIEEGEANLLRPRPHQRPHGLSGRVLERAPQILRAGVPVAVRLQVAPEPAAERVFPEELLEHPEDRGALAVADLVEDLPDLGGVLDPDLDRMRVPEALEGEAAARVEGED